MNDLESISQKLLAGVDLIPDSVVLELDRFRVQILSNSPDLLDRLRSYFSHLLVDGEADCVIHAIEAPPTDLGLTYQDWRREAGKAGRKDAYFNINRQGTNDSNDKAIGTTGDDKDLAVAFAGRVIHKVRTGMLFLQSETTRIAYGPCVANDNQVINFINCQYMNWLQHRGAVICHASGVVMEDQALAIAGFSGGGKSSLMLRILQSCDSDFLTNDRLFISPSDHGDVRAYGIPKLPRVNPGTIVSLPSLRPMLDDQQLELFEALPLNELWNLEQKYDVDITQRYGDNRISLQARLTDLLVLNWSHQATTECKIERVNIQERPDLLEAVMKSPGPFYRDAEGVFQSDLPAANPAPYLDCLEGVNVWEASGKVDFEMAAATCEAMIRTELCMKPS
ncbi:HprK-related kinase B [Neorhodopirellula lusitana]|uniref:HprK-related kinase B n=1 Tax=Neorhodopirellula lusitana TaxID=445327 RepID=A0ABY1Q9G3_9BACT|nr:HprK-related kinase B [Neorhodopirellula lusitana]SMP64151.1 HprK-related kinase B [Neorhodopirellula lusitana]